MVSGSGRRFGTWRGGRHDQGQSKRARGVASVAHSRPDRCCGRRHPRCLDAGFAVAETPAQFIYRVSHSTFGDIGTYTNTVEPNQNGTTVQTKAHFEVNMLGVRMYREDAQRTERWQGNRLISFHGVTDKGSGPVEIKGEARGNGFVITSPLGTISAPASVHPANPWSDNFLTSNTMMRPDSARSSRCASAAGRRRR